MNYQSTKENDAISSNAMAATSHPLATEEALKILKKGGNAVDASITASIILSVVEPNATSIGGDCFAIIKMEGKEPVAYNGSGIAPEKAKKIGHPAPFPVELPKKFIELYSFKEDVILDPFMGSGSTAIAAKLLDRNFIGYEISEEYIELANIRLKETN